MSTAAILLGIHMLQTRFSYRTQILAAYFLFRVRTILHMHWHTYVNAKDIDICACVKVDVDPCLKSIVWNLSLDF